MSNVTDVRTRGRGPFEIFANDFPAGFELYESFLIIKLSAMWSNVIFILTIGYVECNNEVLSVYRDAKLLLRNPCRTIILSQLKDGK